MSKPDQPLSAFPRVSAAIDAEAQQARHVAPPRSLAVLGIAVEGVQAANPDARALVDIVRELIAHNDALQWRVHALEAETKRLRGEP